MHKVFATMAKTGLLDDHTYCAQYAFTHLGALVKAVRLFIRLLYNQPMYPKMCSIDIFVTSNWLAEIFEG